MPVTLIEPWKGRNRAQLRSCRQHAINMMHDDRRRRGRDPKDSALMSVRDLIFLGYFIHGCKQLLSVDHKIPNQNFFPEVANAAAASALSADQLANAIDSDTLPEILA